MKVVVYLTDVRHREAVYRTMGEYIKGVHPGLDRPGGAGAGAARMAGRDRRHRRDPGLTAMTFSLVARCAETGMFGVAISSSSPAVAARCAYARAGVGAVASQNVTDPTPGAARAGPDGAGRERRGGHRRW